jgi:hypothetical protein
MQGLRDSKPRPLIALVLEALAFAAGWNKGFWTVTLEFEDGTLRRWSVIDPPRWMRSRRSRSWLVSAGRLLGCRRSAWAIRWTRPRFRAAGTRTLRVTRTYLHLAGSESPLRRALLFVECRTRSPQPRSSGHLAASCDPSIDGSWLRRTAARASAIGRWPAACGVRSAFRAPRSGTRGPRNVA